MLKTNPYVNEDGSDDLKPGLRILSPRLIKSMNLLVVSVLAGINSESRSGAPIRYGTIPDFFFFRRRLKS